MTVIRIKNAQPQTTPGKEDDSMDGGGRERLEHVLEVERRTTKGIKEVRPQGWGRCDYMEVIGTPPWKEKVRLHGWRR